MDECIFCKIAAGEVPATRVYEDDNAVAFLERYPAVRGHTLVIPKTHGDEETLYDLDEALFTDVTRAARRVARALQQQYAPRRVSMLTYGFDVAHAHMHLIPLHDGNEVRLTQQKDPIANEEAARIAEELQAAVAGVDV